MLFLHMWRTLATERKKKKKIAVAMVAWVVKIQHLSLALAMKVACNYND